jgi:hypothetical protein
VVVEVGQGLFHLRAQLAGEGLRIQGFAELRVVLGPAVLEVGREVLVRVAPLVGTDDPDFLAA